MGGMFKPFPVMGSFYDCFNHIIFSIHQYNFIKICSKISTTLRLF